MKTPEVTFKDNWFKGGTTYDDARDIKTREKLARTDIENAILDGIARAKTGLTPLNEILKKKKRKNKISAWKNNALLVEYFGKKKIKPRHIKAVRRRLRRSKKRLEEKKLKLTIKKQSDAPKSSFIALNRGAFFSPNSFVIFATWFDKSAVHQATNLIHELLHDWLTDKKIDGKYARSQAQARKLAKKKPRKARRNPSNFQYYCY